MRTALLLMLCGYFSGYAQQEAPFGQVRYEEDYTYLEKDTVADWYARAKYTKINTDAYISLGGDFRTQYLLLGSEDWDTRLKDDDGVILTRWLLHTDLHLTGRFRVFAELQSALANSREIQLPIEEDPLELHQAFIDFLPFRGKPITIRAGRQELYYGSQRLINLRDVPNNRRSFDGIKAFYSKGGTQADIFYSHAVVEKLGIFDDHSGSDLRLWGAFTSIAAPSGACNLNFYYFGFYNTHALYNDAAGTETRHTLGARIYKNTERWKCDLESIYQFGSVSSRKISAWSAALVASYTFTSVRFLPEIGLRADVISGDRDTTDGRHQTLNPLFAPGAYFGMAAKVGPSNLLDLHPNFTLHLSKAAAFTCDYAFLWRYSTGDVIYRPNMVPYFAPGDSKSRYIGSQISGTVIYAPNKYITLLAGASWFSCGGYLNDVSPGDDILFGFASAQVKF